VFQTPPVYARLVKKACVNTNSTPYVGANNPKPRICMSPTRSADDSRLPTSTSNTREETDERAA